MEFEEIRLENSPFILLDFQGKDVFSQEREEILLDNGPIKKIKNVYSKDNGKASSLLDFILGVACLTSLIYAVLGQRFTGQRCAAVASLTIG